jgi:hypothetical protein
MAIARDLAARFASHTVYASASGLERAEKALQVGRGRSIGK